MKSCVLTLTLLVLLEKIGVAFCDLALLPRGAHAFMYLWYGEPDTDGVYKHWNHDILPHWEERVNKAYPNVGKRFNPPHDIHSPFYPLHGPYSSQNPAVIKRQFDELLSAGIEVAVVSWWGQRDKPYAADTQGVNTDIMMAKLLQEADKFNKELVVQDSRSKGIKIAFHLEPYPSRSISSINEDLKYISDNYGHHECLYRGTDGRIVYYVYDSYHIAPIQWARLLSSDGDLSVRGGPADGIFFGLWLQHFHGRDLKNGYFDGFYTYFGTDGFSYGSTSSNWRSMCQFARLQPPLICGLSVGPGYNDSLIRPWNTHNERSRANGKYYEHMWKHAIKANPTIISITSYNEWGEGTQIEPARSFQSFQSGAGTTRSSTEAERERSFKEMAPSISAEQLKSGVDIDEIAAKLEDHGDLAHIELFTTPGAETVIGSQASGLREDARPIKQKVLPGVGKATQRFTGAAYYDEGDTDGDGVADSGGNMVDFKPDEDGFDNKVSERKHITTRKLEELRHQKERLAKIESEHQEGIDLTALARSASTPDGRRKLRLYEDYGSAGPFSYLRSTKKYISEFLKVEENVSGKNRNEL